MLANSEKKSQITAQFSPTLQDAYKAHIDWQKDRQLIDVVNNFSVDMLLGLMNDEISELNGGDEAGPFAEEIVAVNPARRDDYRQQEVSDIAIFAMAAFDKVNTVLDTDRIYEQAQSLADQHGFEIVGAEAPLTPPLGISDEQDKVYLQLRQHLTELADSVAVKKDDPVTLTAVLEEIVVDVVAIHSLLGVNSARAILEKVSRNMLKYPAFMFALPEADYSDEELNSLYGKMRSLCNGQFDGPINPETGARPKIGTADFYLEPENRVSEPGEVQELSSFYRTLAQVVSGAVNLSWRFADAKKIFVRK